MLIDLVFGSAHISVRIFVTPLFMGKFRFLPARSLFAYFFPSRTRTKLCTFRPLMLMAAGFESSQAEASCATVQGYEMREKIGVSQRQWLHKGAR